ncbi:MAG: phosphotransferase family protein [Acidimicrobiales bacterium]
MSRSGEIDRLEGQVVRAVAASEVARRIADRPDVLVMAHHVHRGSLGIDLEVRNGSTETARRLFAKTMRAHSWDRYAEEQAGRAHPRLRRAPDPGRRLAREGATLKHIAEMVADAHDPGFFAVTVAESMPDEGVLLLDHVDCVTLSEAIGGGTGLDRAVVVSACRNAGRWLRRFHSIEPPPHCEPGPSTNAELVAMLDRFAEHLRRTAGSGWSAAMDALVHRVGPALEPSVSAVGHGDFAAHNVFVGHDGAVGVFDTHAPLVLPVELDLAYFVMMLRFADLKGVLPSHRSRLDPELEAAFLAGYGATDPDLGLTLAPFEVLVLLDRWCSITATRGTMSPVRTMAKYLRRRVHIRRIRAAFEQVVARIESES